MVRWRAELGGHQFDLEDLPRTFSAPPVRVAEEDGRFYLEADEFEQLDDAMQVRSAAETLITRINGVMRLEDPSRKNVEVGDVQEITPEGPRTTHVILADGIQGRSKVSASLTVIGGGPAPPPAPPAAVVWAELASRDRDVAEAMEIWANREHDWVNLYKIYEIVAERGGLAATAVSQSEIRRFKHTANHQGAAGADARHARLRADAPKNPMALDEADALVGRLFRDWLNSL